MRQILIVANQTLGGDELAALVRLRVEEDLTEFFLLVPILPASKRSERPTFALSTGVPLPMTRQLPDEATRADAARSRLQTGLDRLRRLGVLAEGEVGDSDPLVAIDKVLARRPIDEIIISTLPPGVSRWLRQDLARRVQRRPNLPVTVVTATSPGSR
jgi:hypothetical protein